MRYWYGDVLCVSLVLYWYDDVLCVTGLVTSCVFFLRVTGMVMSCVFLLCVTVDPSIIRTSLIRTTKLMIFIAFVVCIK